MSSTNSSYPGKSDVYLVLVYRLRGRGSMFSGRESRPVVHHKPYSYDPFVRGLSSTPIPLTRTNDPRLFQFHHGPGFLDDIPAMLTSCGLLPGGSPWRGKVDAVAIMVVPSPFGPPQLPFGTWCFTQRLSDPSLPLHQAGDSAFA